MFALKITQIMTYHLFLLSIKKLEENKKCSVRLLLHLNRQLIQGHTTAAAILPLPRATPLPTRSKSVFISNLVFQTILWGCIWRSYNILQRTTVSNFYTKFSTYPQNWPEAAAGIKW